MRKVIIALVVAAATAAIIVPLALGANSGNAQACQQNGWQGLVRADGTSFANQDACVQYGAQGGILYHYYNFSDAANGTKPLTFPGGTIDASSYAAGDPIPAGWGGSVLVAGPYFNGFASGTHFLFTGIPQNTAKFTLTNPAKSVQVQAQSDKTDIDATLTLTGYDASGAEVAQTTDTHHSDGAYSAKLKINSASANIKWFTVTNNDGGYNYGLGVSNILWG